MTASTDAASLPWDQRQRLRFTEALLIWRGAVSAGDIRDTFDISTGKAERDLARYRRLAPENLILDRATGRWHPADAFVPRFLRGTASEYLQLLSNHADHADHAEALASALERPNCTCRIATNGRQALDILAADELVDVGMLYTQDGPAPLPTLQRDSGRY